MKKWLIAGAFCICPMPSQAGYFDTGNDYWARCFGKQNIICAATAASYLDMMEALGYKCSIDGVDRAQTKDVLLKYMADHPEDRNIPASFLAISAFQAAFNCKIPPKPMSQ